MLSLIIWWAGFSIEVSILFRGIRAKLLPRYPFFFAQLSCVVLSDGLAYILYFLRRPWYDASYWSLQLLTMIIACGMILEVLRHVLSPHEKTKKVAAVTRWMLFGAIFVFVAAYLSAPRLLGLYDRNVAFERDFRAFQAVFLIAVLAVIFRYGIPIGRNLKGMILGYGIYIATSLVLLAVNHYLGPHFDDALDEIQPFSYVVALAIWLVSFWNYHPNHAPSAEIQAVSNRERIYRRSRIMIDAMRAYLALVPRL